MGRDTVTMQNIERTLQWTRWVKAKKSCFFTMPWQEKGSLKTNLYADSFYPARESGVDSFLWFAVAARDRDGSPRRAGPDERTGASGGLAGHDIAEYFFPELSPLLSDAGDARV